MLTTSSRRGLFRGATGLAAVAVVGCPKAPVVPDVATADLLAGISLREETLAMLARTLRAAALDRGTFLVQQRRVTVATRTLDGPSLRQEDVVGMVLRIERDGIPTEVASSRVDDETLLALVERAGLTPVAAPTEAEGADAGPVLQPVPTATSSTALPALAPVGAGLALLVDALRSGTPRAAAVQWEGVEDDRLVLGHDGRLARRLRRHGRVVVDVELVGPAGLHRVVRQLPSDPFRAEDPSGALSAAADAVLAAAAARSAAREPTAATVAVLLGAQVQVEVASARARASGRSLDLAARARFDQPEVGGPFLLAQPGASTAVDPADLPARVHVRGLWSAPEVLPGGDVLLVLADADWTDATGPVPLASGSILRVPAAAWDAPAVFAAGEGTPTASFESDGPLAAWTGRWDPSLPTLVSGPVGEGVETLVLASARLLPDCELEAYRGR